MKSILLAVLAILFLNACGSCVQEVSGIVEDSAGYPIQGAVVHKMNSWPTDTTCEKGFFHITDISGGFLECPDMDIIIVKEGYESEVLSIDAGGFKKIRLKPLNKVKK